MKIGEKVVSRASVMSSGGMRKGRVTICRTPACCPLIPPNFTLEQWVNGSLVDSYSGDLYGHYVTAVAVHAGHGAGGWIVVDEGGSPASVGYLDVARQKKSYFDQVGDDGVDFGTEDWYKVTNLKGPETTDNEVSIDGKVVHYVKGPDKYMQFLAEGYLIKKYGSLGDNCDGGVLDPEYCTFIYLGEGGAKLFKSPAANDDDVDFPQAQNYLYGDSPDDPYWDKNRCEGGWCGQNDYVKWTRHGYSVDLDVDSDNDGWIDDPEKPHTKIAVPTPGTGPAKRIQDWVMSEEDVEDTLGLGKWMVVCDGDEDGDNIADFADGYNRDGQDPDDDVVGDEDHDFVEMRLQYSNLSDGLVKFDYDEHDPDNIEESDPDGEGPEPPVYSLTGDGCLRIWKQGGSQEREGDFIPAGGDGFGQGSIPTTLWVEGVRATTTKTSREITVKVTGGGMPSGLEAKDTVHVSAIGLKPYRDPSYTKILDDWPQAPDLIRSPKYIFGQDDPIYFEVKGPVNPKAAGVIKDLVKVNTSCAGAPCGGPVYLTLKETATNSAVFRNSLAPGNLLYLDDETRSHPKGYRIKVINEEVLTFAFREPDSPLLPFQKPTKVYIDKDPGDATDVKVDAGEHFEMAGSIDELAHVRHLRS